MKKSLQSAGTGWNLYVPKSILELLAINPSKHKALFTMSDNILYIEKVGDDDDEKYQDMAVRKFHKSGNGYALFMTQTIIELLEINPEVDMLDLRVKGQVLEVKKALKNA